MKTIQDIKSARQAKMSDMFHELGIFFAFGQEQFDRSRKPDVAYVSGGYGMCIPENNVEAYKKRFDRIIRESNEELRENIDMDRYIEYQLDNYEVYYTRDISEAYAIVKEIYPQCTTEDVWRVLHMTDR